jgi:hypothetical protein
MILEIEEIMKTSLGVDRAGSTELELARLDSLSNRAREPAQLGSFASLSWLV